MHVQVRAECPGPLDARRFYVAADGVLRRSMTGVHQYTDALLSELTRLFPHQVVPFLPLAPHKDVLTPFVSGSSGAWSQARKLDWAGPITCGPVTRRRPARFAVARYRRWTALTRAARATSQQDLVHLTLPHSFMHEVRSKAFVVTLYDLSFRHYPSNFEPEAVRAWEAYTQLAIERADHIITISEFVKAELIRSLGVAPDRITAIPLAPRTDDAQWSERSRLHLIANMGVVQPFVLYAGSVEPRKGVITLLEAFARTKGGVRLVLAGKVWRQSQEAIDVAIQRLRLGDRVSVLGYVTDHQLQALMESCTVFAYLSEYEGFGLPPLEAMKRGAPVLTTRAASLPEVVGNAAMLVEPGDVTATHEALDRLIGSSELRQSLREQGLLRAAQFSWSATATATFECYERAASASCNY